MVICIFVKGLRVTPTIVSNIYEKDSQTLAEVIRLVEKLSAAHQLTAIITPSTISMMSIDDRCFVCGQTGHLASTVLMPSVMAVMNLATLPRTAPTRFLLQECHATMADLIQGIDTSTLRGTYNTTIMAPDIRDISAGHSPTPIHTVTEAAVLEGTPHTPLPTTAAACATPQLMDVPVTPCAVILTGTVASHPALTTFPTDTTHPIPQTRASLASATPTAQYKDLSPEKSSNNPDAQHPINPTAPRLSPSRIPLQILTVTLII